MLGRGQYVDTVVFCWCFVFFSSQTWGLRCASPYLGFYFRTDSMLLLWWLGRNIVLMYRWHMQRFFAQ